MARNVVELEPHVAQYLVASPWKGAGRCYRLARGRCNGLSFWALLRIDAGLDSAADLFCDNERPFAKAEYQSIRRKLKATEPTRVVDRRALVDAAGGDLFFPELYRRLFDAQYGAEVALCVPFAEKDAAKALGATWNPLQRAWVSRTKAPHHAELVARWGAPADHSPPSVEA